ncbi:MAG TPA: histidine kinase [Terriglobia bacterium]|nr:histidine kinase [Terriglobia bacterium]
MLEPAPVAARGNLRIYLGYAAGVGKTYQMLDDGHDLRRDGVDVVVGYLEPHGRKDTIAKAEGLEIVPRRKQEYRGAAFEDMDTPAILKRRPRVCLVDEFAHTNVPGSERAKRWEDVEVLLAAGIDVITTMNVQHLESLNDQIRQITKVRVRETIPDWVVQQANEVVMVDLPPEALLNRLRRGAVYPPEKAEKALANFFTESNLTVLREFALRQTAHEVDARQAVEEPAAPPSPCPGDDGPARITPPRQTDRILIYVTDHPLSAMLIRRGKRVADYLRADCFAVAVRPELDPREVPADRREALARHLSFARNLHIETRTLLGGDVARTLVEFARQQRVTQIYLARPQAGPRLPFVGRDLVQQVVRLASDMQVTVVAERRPHAEGRRQ